MGIVAALTGNASEIDAAEGQALFLEVLLPDEQVEEAYQLFRDAFVFTSWRMIFKDAQGMTGKKVEYHSFPYRSMSHFSIESAGTFDLDAELKVFISGSTSPVISRRFNKKLNIYDVARVLAQRIRG